MVRYALAATWYHLVYAYVVLRGGRDKLAPEYLMRAYDGQARAWNRVQNRSLNR